MSEPYQLTPDWEPSEEKPFYRKVRENGTSNLFLVSVDEGWRVQLMCSGMYEWAADWLIRQVQGKPYARPVSVEQATQVPLGYIPAGQDRFA